MSTLNVSPTASPENFQCGFVAVTMDKSMICTKYMI